MGESRKGNAEPGYSRPQHADRTPKIALLLTATIDVGDVAFVRRANAADRAQDYRDALRWLTGASLPNPIVFCENSRYDLSELIREYEGCGAPIEWIQFAGKARDSSLGKGRGELEIIRYALEHSRALAEADLVVKITGRYKIRNIKDVLASLRQPVTPMVVADLRHWLAFADSRVCAFHPVFPPKYLYALEPQMNDSKGFYFEHALARAIHLALADGAVWAPWPVEPDIDGLSGTGGHRYGRSIHKRLFRRMLRRILRYGLTR